MSKFDKTHSQDFIRRMDTEEKIAEMYMPYVEEIISQIGYSPETILDIGTGPGAVPMLLGEIFSGAKVFGIDSSKYMVSHANSKRMKNGLTNVVFEVGDGRALRWDDESFDLVLSKGVFKMIPNRHLFLKEMWRVLKPGKCAFISDDSMPDDEKNKVRSALERSLTVDELRRILETSGLPLKPVITTRGYRFMVRLAKD
jgi:ubiquinone/menaquinone biosynthesis C-methylase UbiE